jgi:hypothetical protein
VVEIPNRQFGLAKHVERGRSARRHCLLAQRCERSRSAEFLLQWVAVGKASTCPFECAGVGDRRVGI